MSATSVDDILSASGTGKSQFYHYFESKQECVREVLGYQLERFVTEQGPRIAAIRDLPGLDAWAAGLVAWNEENGCVGGCPFGNMTAEVSDSSDEVREDVARAFETWRHLLAGAVARMRASGELREDADPEVLAQFLMAVLQGGLLFMRAQRDVTPLRVVLEQAVRHVRSYAVVD